MLALHLAFLGLLVGTQAFFTWLDVANLRHGERVLAERAEWVAERFGVEDVDRIADYHRARVGLSTLRSWVVLVVGLLALYSGLFADAAAAVADLGGPALTGAVIFAGLSVALAVLALPFDAVEAFVVEELFGFNERTPALWVRDQALGLAIGAVIAGALGAAFLAVVSALPGLWWLGGTALFLAFGLVMQVVYPRVIAPLFNDFVPVEEGELHEAVEAVFERAGFTCEGIYEMDASRRSSHSNAYFVGFGRAKRVVLFDTLVEQLSVPALQGVLAHELAHWKEHHVWKGVAAGTVEVGVLLALAQYLLSTTWLYRMFGLPTDATAAGLVLAAVWLAPVGRLASPLTNRLSLAFEREADDFAAAVVAPGAMVDALATIAGENLANPFPHPLYETFHYDHPPIPERIRRLEARGEAEESAPSGGDEGAATV